MAITFKRHKKEGRYRSFQTTYTDIKRGPKAIIGSIRETSLGGGYDVGIMVKDPKHPGWRWVFFKKSFLCEVDARDWVLRNYSVLELKYDIHQIDD